MFPSPNAVPPGAQGRELEKPYWPRKQLRRGFLVLRCFHIVYAVSMIWRLWHTYKRKYLAVLALVAVSVSTAMASMVQRRGWRRRVAQQYLDIVGCTIAELFHSGAKPVHHDGDWAYSALVTAGVGFGVDASRRADRVGLAGTMLARSVVLRLFDKRQIGTSFGQAFAVILAAQGTSFVRSKLVATADEIQTLQVQAEQTAWAHAAAKAQAQLNAELTSAAIAGLEQMRALWPVDRVAALQSAQRSAIGARAALRRSVDGGPAWGLHAAVEGLVVRHRLAGMELELVVTDNEFGAAEEIQSALVVAVGIVLVDAANSLKPITLRLGGSQDDGSIVVRVRRQSSSLKDLNQRLGRPLDDVLGDVGCTYSLEDLGSAGYRVTISWRTYA